jgi:small subunit ribosomal protein S2
VIPGNDDAIRSCHLVIKALADGIEAGKRKVTSAELQNAKNERAEAEAAAAAEAAEAVEAPPAPEAPTAEPPVAEDPVTVEAEPATGEAAE